MPDKSVGQSPPPQASDSGPSQLPSPPAEPPGGTAPKAQRAYTGPTSGIANWSGKLGKGDSLTITAGTPSKGVITGAGLPGVPVHLTIDQSNLGFAEMPNASNGYNRLVILSHAKHDRLTIRWSLRLGVDRSPSAANAAGTRVSREVIARKAPSFFIGTSPSRLYRVCVCPPLEPLERASLGAGTTGRRSRSKSTP